VVSIAAVVEQDDLIDFFRPRSMDAQITCSSHPGTNSSLFMFCEEKLTINYIVEDVQVCGISISNSITLPSAIREYLIMVSFASLPSIHNDWSAPYVSDKKC
jgi:hypothetical protein